MSGLGNGSPQARQGIWLLVPRLKQVCQRIVRQLYRSRQQEDPDLEMDPLRVSLGDVPALGDRDGERETLWTWEVLNQNDMMQGGLMIQFNPSYDMSADHSFSSSNMLPAHHVILASNALHGAYRCRRCEVSGLLLSDPGRHGSRSTTGRLPHISYTCTHHAKRWKPK
jgi:hypothetical protein